jgi:hypothetical protein
MHQSSPSRRWRWAAVVVVLLSLAAVNPYVRGDGNGYYAWLVSPVIDGDVDFTNQFRRADPLFQTLIFEPDGSVRPEARTDNGHVRNQWSVGPAVLWAPWFLVAHAGVAIARLAGASIPADGYSWPYLWAVSIGTAAYGWLAMWLSVRIAAGLGLTRGIGLAVLGIALGSSLPVYQFFLPFHVHALCAFAVAAYLAFWMARRARMDARDWWVWGALAGLMVQVYQLNGILLIVAAWQLVLAVRSSGASAALLHAMRFTAAGLLACLPQIVGKSLLYGSPLRTGYQDEFVWMAPRLWDTAWSANHGVLLWTPVLILALAGLARLIRDRRDLVVLGVVVVAFYIVVACYQNWHGQSSFGNRFFVSLTPVFLVGLAVLADAAVRAGRGRVMGALLVVLVWWNVGVAFQWGTNIIPNRGPVRFSEVARNQVTVVPARLAAFAARYLLNRRGLVDEIEHGDRDERRRYELVR